MTSSWFCYPHKSPYVAEVSQLRQAVGSFYRKYEALALRRQEMDRLFDSWVEMSLGLIGVCVSCSEICGQISCKGIIACDCCKHRLFKKNIRALLLVVGGGGEVPS